MDPFRPDGTLPRSWRRRVEAQILRDWPELAPFRRILDRLRAEAIASLRRRPGGRRRSPKLVHRAGA